MEVSLDNCVQNFLAIDNLVKKHNSRTMAVIKANAYGLGAVPVALALSRAGADFCGVATPDEARELRNGGINAPIIVLGSSPYSAAGFYVRENIRAAITDIKMAQSLSDAAVKLNRPAFVHLKIDTGMGRIGYLPDDALDIAEQIYRLPGLNFEGVFTHFSTADEPNLTHTHEQYKIFRKIVGEIKSAGIKIPIVHSSNSGAILANLSEMFDDMVRPGHILNGLPPSWDCGTAVKVLPCMEVKSAVGVVRTLPADMGVGYGLTYKTLRETKIAVVPIGYADGYNRALSNIGEVLIHGSRCPIIGRVSMDQTTVNISHLENVCAGDEVVLIGRQGDEFISVSEMAKKLSTIPAVIQLNFNVRVPKVYI